MNINYKQPQFELFPPNSSTLADVNKPRFLLANLTLSLESLVILSILGIMVALFSFCLGIERGKRLVAQAMDERVSAAWNITVKKPLPRTFIPVTAAPPVRPAAVRSAPLQAGLPAEAKGGSTLAKAGTRFTVQVSSYKNQGFARTEALALQAKGYKAFLIKTGDFILVCVGQFSSNEAAGAALKKLPPHYRPGLVRRF
ncbi:MAG: SPOR domain-containing protein [Candidatus Omnitrophota bacterium]|nr:SPOR domain-containing protein [Candidatus Omnitrophota bacterium]